MVLDNGRGTGEFGAIRRVAMISVHTSPLARLGEKDAGGLNVYVRELSRQLGRLGVAVDIFTRRADPDVPDIVPCDENVRVVHVSAGPPAPVDKNALFDLLPGFASEMALFALRDGVSYDVVHGHYWLSGWVAHLLRRYWDVPVVQMFHTLGHLKQDAARAAGAADGGESAQRIAIEREVMERADAIVAANARERAEMVWWYGMRAPKIATIGCGIDLDLFRPRVRAAARAALGFGDAPALLYVGRIDPVKGIGFLLDGFARLRADWRGPVAPRLDIVGGELRGGELGPDLAGLRDRAAARGVADGIHFHGPRPHEALPEYYAAADVAVVPSRYESFGLVAVEAMACGTPVVASHVGGLAYTIEDGENGFLVPYGDGEALAGALARVLGDDALRARLGAGALATAAGHSWAGVTRQVLALYRDLAARRGAAVGAGLCLYGGD
ncbi:MAG TPA: glycosyltransferase [Thermomicrobiales bacterium]|nr:glycosyltransferase [Thermomicrobiales bacterium]